MTFVAMRIPKAGKGATEEANPAALGRLLSTLSQEYLKIFTTFDNYFTPKK